MTELRRIFEAAGFAKVETFIASGNIIFDSRSKNEGALEKKLAGELGRELGYAVAVFIRSAAKVNEIAEYPAFPKPPPESTLYIAFLSTSVSAERQAKLISLESKTDKFRFHERELYWLVLTKLSDSKVSGPVLEKVLGTQITVRNSNTVRKLAAKFEADV